MKVPKLDYPVHTLDKRLILPADTPLTTKTLDAMIASNKGTPHKAYPFLEYSSVHQDVLRLIQNPPYDFIFGELEKRIALSIMEEVRFIPPVMESLNYFKESDYYTYRHILIVFALTAITAYVLLENSEDHVIETMAGHVHDIGKICIPLQVLKKSNPLTRSDKGILEHHTLAGFVLLSYFLQDSQSFVAQISKEHHERRDGSGYPLGILLKDRMVEIICACDIYDALLSSRPYRLTPYENRTALEEISGMASGGMLSREIVQTLVSFNRKDKPHFRECQISKEKRGMPPADNLYGIIVDEDTDANEDNDG